MAKLDVEIPPVKYRRGKQPLLKRLLNPFKAPFTEVLGRPNLQDSIHQRVDCGHLEAEFYCPRAAMGHSDDYPEEVDLNNDRLFDRTNIDERTSHKLLKLAGSNWGYAPPRLHLSRFLPVPQEPYIIVTAFWNLERVKNGIQLDVGNMEMLEQYLRDDYYAFLESEGGHNWTVRKNEYEEMGPSGRNAPQEVIDSFIAAQIHTPPRAYETLSYNGQPWLRYRWAPRQNYPDGLIYTTALTPNTLFTVYFSLTEMLGGCLKHWWRIRKS